MTLTFKTAKHAIDKNGEVTSIVEHFDDVITLSVTRAEAEEISEYDPDFKPCIVVTTAREAIEAAWELAYEPEDGAIPANAEYIRLRRSDGKFYLSHSRLAIEANDMCDKRRLLDPPEPEPEPEPREESRFCYADGDFYERIQGSNVAYWMRPRDEGVYRRIYLKPLNPRPVTIEGVEE